MNRPGFPIAQRANVVGEVYQADCVDADGLPLTTDQRGEPRPVAIRRAEPKCDIGAFEVQP